MPPNLQTMLAVGLLLLALLHLVLTKPAPNVFAPFPPDGPPQEPLPVIPLPDRPRSVPELDTLNELQQALKVMQSEYFAIWQGIWTTAIDWTSAVMGTHLAASLRVLVDAGRGENEVDTFYSQLIAFYFGQDAFGLRQQAYDDMLWVVLGWLESVQFIQHRAGTSATAEPWHGTQFQPAFAHRARLFWQLAANGWDTKLCGGGMFWNSRNPPYKNAITNELFIAASVSMYLHFPGDDNEAEFDAEIQASSHPPRNPRYLAAAIEGYRWLGQSNMTDASGLYVDGFHISNWAEEARNETDVVPKRCDERDETVYTYNQGVLLTAQRGLYEATGARSYLQDGHALIASVIAATGYDLVTDRPPSPPVFLDPNRPWPSLGKWQGLGRSGVLEEFCDARAYCSQDAQTFKGIFFHHFTTFCAPLPQQLFIFAEGEGTVPPSHEEVAAWHELQCQRYHNWVRGNAVAALRSRDANGKFGMWWSAPQGDAADLLNTTALNNILPEQVLPLGASDPRNWPDRDGSLLRHKGPLPQFVVLPSKQEGDLNDRGRGRTVESQSGGLAVLRALWAMEHR